MSDQVAHGSDKPLGQMALYTMLGISGPAPHTRSYLGSRLLTRRFEDHIDEVYTPRYDTDGSIEANLRFAFRHEPLDMRIVYRALTELGRRGIEQWVRSHPTAGSSRRAWFLYETFSGDVLGLDSARQGKYVDVLDVDRHVTSKPVSSPRHRVYDNLLGGPLLCPTVRRTDLLRRASALELSERARSLAAEYAPELLARAVAFLYTKETRTSFEIEGERVAPKRAEKFVQALKSAADFDYHEMGAFLNLQAGLVDPRYAATGWRDVQNFVGSVTRNFGDHVEYVCPRPADVPDLMRGWSALVDRLLTGTSDPIAAAAVSAFAFVFIHPFEDGNGRIHRFLIHHMLGRMGFGPPGVVFPVSAAIMRQRDRYDRVLETFSKPSLEATDWRFLKDRSVEVLNDTRDLYRFFDATPFVEFLYDRVAETIELDLKDELDFLRAFDTARRRIGDIVDMPDRHVLILIRSCMYNEWRVSNKVRKSLPELTDHEIARIESVVQAILGKFRPESGRSQDDLPADY
jgi:Fic family protein